jgi:flagellar basal-body rod modification protein FlgD
MDVSAIAASAKAAAEESANKLNTLSTDDFLTLLVTELTNQDPFEPMTNQQLLEQVSSIRNLQMNTELNDTLKSLVLQGNLGAAAGLIGKMVTGVSTAQDPVTGMVAGVLVSDGEVMLELDNGSRVGIEDVVYVEEAGASDDAVET